MSDMWVLKKSILKSSQKDVSENLRMERAFVQKFGYWVNIHQLSEINALI